MVLVNFLTMRLRSIIVIFLGLVASSLTSAQGTFFSKNLAHYYDLDAEIRMGYRVITYQDKTQLYLKLTINEERTRITDLVTRYALLNGYSNEIVFEPDTVDLNAYHQHTELNNHYFRFDVSNENRNKLLIIKILNTVTGNDFYFDLPADPAAVIANSKLILKWPNQQIPYYRQYIRNDEPAEILNLGTADSTLFGFHYKTDFRIADPPFSNSSGAVIKSISIDSAFTIPSNQPVVFPTTGMYFIQTDTTSSNGLTFRSEKKPFPRQGRYEELIESLTYFSTRSEIDRLENAPDKKKAFDGYWIEITKSSERARKVIRSYYSRVNLANQVFTTYKQGWKTDKGMIYIIFGAPDEVLRNGDREEWIYERSTQLPRINFTFVKAKSIFTNEHYVLLRKSSYQQVWYKAIDLWRKGQMDL